MKLGTRRLIISIGVAALLYLTLITGVDMQRTVDAIVRLGMPWWLAILGLSLFNYALRFGRWHAYLHWLGNRIGIARHALIYLAGFALTTTPGKAGETVRAVYLARRGVPYAHSLAALFAERFVDLLAMALLAMLVLIAFSGYALWVIVPLAGLALLLVAIRQRRLLNAARRRFADPETRVQRLLHGLVNAWDQAFALLALRPLYMGLAIGLVAWSAEGVSVWLIAHALDQHLVVGTAIGIYAAGIVVGALSFLPGGLGSTEAVMALLLKLSGIDTATAIAITLIARIATLWFAVALGVIALACLEIGRRRAPHSIPEAPAPRRHDL